LEPERLVDARARQSFRAERAIAIIWRSLRVSRRVLDTQ
jgi:hypothetical protein